MQYDAPPRRRSSSGVLVFVILLGFLFLVGVAVVGIGALVFASSARTHEMRAVIQQDMARQQVEEARARAEEAHARAENIRERLNVEIRHPSASSPQVTVEAEPAESPETASSIRIANREVTIRLDEEGKIQVDGTACELPQLKELLAKASEGREDAIVVLVSADKRCLFEHVAGVLAVCKELKLSHVRVGALGE